MLLHHWQWFALAGVLAPMGMTGPKLLLLLAYPLWRAFETGHDMGWHLERIGCIQLVAWGWIFLQRRALSGGGFAPYLRTLPLTLYQRLAADIALLVVGNTVLLAPLAATLPMAPTLGSSAGAALWAGIGALSALTLVAQLALLQHRPFAIVPVLIGDLALSAILAKDAALACWMTLAASLVLGLWTLNRASVRDAVIRAPSRASRPPRLSSSWLPPEWRIQYKALASHPASLLRALAALGIMAGAHVLLVAFAFDDRAIPTAALALAVLALVLTGWYRTLHTAHAPVSAYLNTLPLPAHFWKWRDIGFMMIVGALPASLLFGELLAHLAHRILTLCALLAGYGGLLVAMRFPILHGGRQAPLLAVLVVGAWSAVALAATS
ncbi:MAG: DUF6136 family protein [Janthinobacterium lividum]